MSEQSAPPAGEELHLPGQTIVPALNAMGLTFVLLGLTFHWVLSALGGLLFLFTLVRWLRDVRRDVDELPLEH